MSMWSVSHSGHTSVIVTVTDLWLESLLQRPYRTDTPMSTCAEPIIDAFFPWTQIWYRGLEMSSQYQQALSRP